MQSVPELFLNQRQLRDQVFCSHKTVNGEYIRVLIKALHIASLHFSTLTAL